jgi:thioredoxin
MKFQSRSVVMLTLLSSTSAFTIQPPRRVHSTLQMARADILDVASMRLKEIQAELKERKVSYSDCYDKESLVARLIQARNTPSSVLPDNPPTTEAAVLDLAHPSSDFDRESTLAALRSMRVAELRAELGNRKLRWANMFEKEELVQALLAAMEASSGFSLSGALKPGEVGMVTGEELDTELSGGASTPLLLDIYATWCGPCKLMAPQLDEAAKELGSGVRVAKIDSDKFPQWSSKLKVGAFPTVIVFDGTGKELQRVEGALMRDQLVQLVKSHI